MIPGASVDPLHRWNPALTIRWINGGLSANPLTIAGVLELGAGVLAFPEFVAVIPITGSDHHGCLSSGLATLLRGQSATDGETCQRAQRGA
jgi:hypothetical protein